MRSPLARGLVWGLAVLVCIACIWMSMHLALLHFRTTANEDKSVLGQVCTGFATSSCQKVGQSRWAWFPPKPDPEAEKSEQAAKGVGEEDPDEEKGSESGAAAQKPAKPTPRVPTAQLGLIYFSFVLCWLVFTGPFPATRQWPHVVFFVGTLLGVPGSIFFEYIMWTQLDAWCPLCLGTHVGSFLLPVFAALLWPRSASGDAEVEPAPVAAAEPSSAGEGLFGPAPARPKATWSDSSTARWPSNYAIFAAVLAAVFLVGLEHFYIVNRSSIYKGLSDKYYAKMYESKWKVYERHWQHHLLAWTLQPAVDVPVEGRPVRGAEDAKHTIVVFSDFECPACSRFESFLMEKVLPLKVGNQQAFKIIFKHWPICRDCNELMEGNSIHPAACEAAYAAEAARILGGDEAFWKMHDMLFANQAAWRKTRDFLPYARKLGLNEEAFVKAMNSSEVLSRVRADIADGVGLGSDLQSATRRAEIKVDSTPTVIVNGKRLNSPQSIRTWQSIANMPAAPVRQPAASTQPAGRAPAAPAIR